MTTDNDALVAELRNILNSRALRDCLIEEDRDVIATAAEAIGILEATIARRVSRYVHAERDRAQAVLRAEKAERERDAYAAVIEKAKEIVAPPHPGDLGQALYYKLTAVPSDILAARDRRVAAEAWDEGALWAATECGEIDNENEKWLAPGDNPYRADAIEKGDRDVG